MHAADDDTCTIELQETVNTTYHACSRWWYLYYCLAIPKT